MSSSSSCFVVSGTPVQLLKVMCSSKETYGFPYGHLIYFHFQEASSSIDPDVLHIRFSVKGVRVTGTHLAELVAALSANTLELVKPAPAEPSISRQQPGNKPFIESVEVVEAQVSKAKEAKG